MRTLHIIKPTDDEPEHKAICSIDGEPWPCTHQRAESHRSMMARAMVFCLACGKRRNAYAYLMIQRGMDDRPIYFHDRKACRPKAIQWWNENVKPYTGEVFIEGRWVDDLARHIGRRCKLAGL